MPPPDGIVLCQSDARDNITERGENPWQDVSIFDLDFAKRVLRGTV
jgi:hypothetical protein